MKHGRVVKGCQATYFTVSAIFALVLGRETEPGRAQRLARVESALGLG